MISTRPSLENTYVMYVVDVELGLGWGPLFGRAEHPISSSILVKDGASTIQRLPVDTDTTSADYYYRGGFPYTLSGEEARRIWDGNNAIGAYMYEVPL